MDGYIKWTIFIALAAFASGSRDNESVMELTICVRMAEPLIHDPNYIFPLTTSEIANVCQMWDGFVGCVRKYTRKFLTKLQQKEFEKAINPSMESIHQLCIKDQEYERAYLNYAPCMKKIAIDQQYCGEHYNFLARITESSIETGSAICCGYHKFRSCALKEAARECEERSQGNSFIGQQNSSPFVASMLNRALGFLLQRCSSYRQTDGDCTKYLSGKEEKYLHPHQGISSIRNSSTDISSPSINSAGGFLNNFGSKSSSDGLSSVSIRPKAARESTFTWEPAPSYFPTGIADIQNEITGPKSQAQVDGAGGSSSWTSYSMCMKYVMVFTLMYNTILTDFLDHGLRNVKI